MKQLQAGNTLLHTKHNSIEMTIQSYCISCEIEMCKMIWTIYTLRMVHISFASLIIRSNLHLHVIVREVDGARIEGMYDVITLLHIKRGIIICVSM